MRHKYFYIDVVRLVLMLLICIVSFGVQIPFGGELRAFCGMATLCFFIFSGFLTLRKGHDTEQKIVRAIKRTAIMAAVMFIWYLLCNVAYLWLSGENVAEVFLSLITNKRVWFEFIVLNNWALPVGENIWFILCLLYGYIVMYFLQKFDLLKFDWIIFLVCMLINLLTGEFAGAIGFSLLGYTYLPATVVTRSVPYLLLGRMIGNWKHHYNTKISTYIYLLAIPVGLILTFLELRLLLHFEVLVYTGHTIGNAVAATGICIFTVLLEQEVGRFTGKTNFFIDKMDLYVKLIYILHQPIGMFFVLLLKKLMPDSYQEVSSVLFILIFAFTLGIAVLLGKPIKKIIHGRHKSSHSPSTHLSHSGTHTSKVTVNELIDNEIATNETVNEIETENQERQEE